MSLRSKHSKPYPANRLHIAISMIVGTHRGCSNVYVPLRCTVSMAVTFVGATVLNVVVEQAQRQHLQRRSWQTSRSFIESD